LAIFFNLIEPAGRLALDETHDDCNFGTGTLILCEYQWWTKLSLTLARWPALFRHQHFLCPTVLYFAWTDTEMRAHWRCHLDGTAEGDYDTCATPPLKASSSEQ
jgi:hypothetical protein